MPSPTARIRRFQKSDDKLVRFGIAKAIMEHLSVANRRVYTHPLTIATWLLISYTIIEYKNLWPIAKYGLLGYLQPIPILAASAVPFLFLIDWLNRPYFEKLTDEVLHRADMADLLGYYSQTPGSGFWVLEYGNSCIGVIALDASDAYRDLRVPDSQPPKDFPRGSKQKTSTAIIRHFYVDEIYRSAGVQEDLLNHASRFAFESNKAIERVQASYSTLSPYISKCLETAGFVAGRKAKKIGVFGWKVGEQFLERSVWDQRKSK